MTINKKTGEKRFRIFIAAYLVLIKDGKVFLSKRKNTGYQDGNYSFVSGHFDGSETARQCIIRETKEEIDIKLKPNNLEIAHVMHYRRPEREYISIYLKADTWGGKIKNMEPDKCDDLAWFSVDKLPNDIVPETKFALKNIKNEIFYSEFGW